MSDAAPVWSFRFEGRMGRLAYATYGALSMALLLLAALHLVTSPTNARLVAYAVFLLALVLLTLRWTVLRLHDMNLSGWWSPLMTLPYAGPVVGLVFSLLPGTVGDNDHGPRPDDGNWLVFVPAVAVLCISAWVSVPTFLALAEEDAIAEERDDEGVGRRPAAQPPSAPDARSIEEARVAFRTRYMTASEPKAFAVSAGGAWGMSDAAASADDAVTAAMVDCEVRRQPAAAPCRLINMNGQGTAPQ